MDTMSDHEVAREEFLEHHGVRGMKWGVRKKPSSSSKRALTSKAKNMSDTELKSAVERLRLEREYVNINKDLADTHPAKPFIAKYGNQAASIAIGSAASAVVGVTLKKLIK